MAEKKKVFYICGVDWQHEVGETGDRFWKSVKELKRNVRCWKSCGIVRVEMSAKWLVKQDLKYRRKKAEKDT